MTESEVIRVLIVDDEQPARQKLLDLLAGADDVTVVGEARNGVEAVELIRERAPELVFLDIQMPGLDGFDVIAEVGVDAMPLVVFVTAYDEHALRAFEVHALDYVLKPFAKRRFERALERARAQLEGEARREMAARLERLFRQADGRRRHLSRLLVEHGEARHKLIAIDDVIVLRAERNYIRIITDDAEYLRRGPLSTIEERLDPDRFLRINRSEIVQISAIKELQPWFHGDYRVILVDDRVLSWSRRFRARAKDLF